MIHAVNRFKLFFCLLLFVVTNASLATNQEEMTRLMGEQFEYMTCKFIANNLDNNEKGSPITEHLKSNVDMTQARDACKDKYPELFSEPNFLIRFWKYLFH